MHSLVISIFLYACESWTLTAEIERKIQGMEMRCYRKVLNISYKDHITNQEVKNRIRKAIGPHEDLLTVVKSRKMNGMGMSQDHRALPRQSCKEQYKEEGEADQERTGGTTSQNGQDYSSGTH